MSALRILNRIWLDVRLFYGKAKRKGWISQFVLVAVIVAAVYYVSVTDTRGPWVVLSGAFARFILSALW
jgi:hypothetical protein